MEMMNYKDKERESDSGYIYILVLVVIAGLCIYILAAAAIINTGAKVVNSKWDKYAQYLSGESEGQSSIGEAAVDDKELNNN